MILIFCFMMQISAGLELAPEYRGKELTVGDPFEVILTLEHPQNKRLSGPFVDSIEPYVLLDQKNKVVAEKGIVTSTYRIKLAAFNTGELKLPRFKFMSQDSTRTDTVQCEEAVVKITSVMSDKMTDINDIKKQFEFPNLLPVIIIAILAGAAILFFLGYKLYLRFRRLHAMAEPQIPCWEEAFAAIERLPVKDLLAKGLIKKYYYALSEILKRYLERRFDFPAIEQTTTEIAASMKFKKIPERDAFGKFFDRADMVKYAKFVPPQNEVEDVVATVKDLITKTMPAETPGRELKK